MSEGYNSHCGVLKWLLCLLCDSWWCNFHLPMSLNNEHFGLIQCCNETYRKLVVILSWQTVSLFIIIIIIIIISTSSYTDFVQVAIQRKADHSIYSVHKQPPPPCPGTFSLPTHPSFPPALRKKNNIVKPLRTRRQRKLRINLQCRVNQILFYL